MVKMQIESNKLALKTNYDQKKRLVGGRRNQNGLVVTVVSELEYKYIDLHIYNEHVTWDNKSLSSPRQMWTVRRARCH